MASREFICEEQEGNPDKFNSVASIGSEFECLIPGNLLQAYETQHSLEKKNSVGNKFNFMCTIKYKTWWYCSFL